LFIYLNSTAPSTYIVAVAVVATLSRFSHAAGMLLAADVNERHTLRFYGALGTYLTLFALGGTLLRSAL
jgi:hypothetical protein